MFQNCPLYETAQSYFKGKPCISILLFVLSQIWLYLIFLPYDNVIFISKEGEFSCPLPVTIGDFLGKKDIEISRDVLDGLILSLKQTAHLCNLDCFEHVRSIV